MALDPKLQKFTTASPVIASYPYADINDNLGYQDYYPCVLIDTTSSKYELVKQTLFSGLLQTTTDSTLSFDTSDFNRPATIKGNAYLQVPCHASDTQSVFITAQISRIDVDAGAHTISSVITSPTFAGNAGVPIFTDIFLLKIPLTETIIAEGEKIRVVIVVDVSAAGTHGIAHDPADRASTTYTISTQSKLSIPFKLDV